MAKRRSFIASARRRFRGRGVDADTSAVRSQQDGRAASVELPAEMFVVCSGHFERQAGCNTTAAGPGSDICSGRFRQSQINVAARTLQTDLLYRDTRNRSGDRAAGSFAGDCPIDSLQPNFTPAGADVRVANKIAHLNRSAISAAMQHSLAVSENNIAAAGFDFRNPVTVVALVIAASAS